MIRDDRPAQTTEEIEITDEMLKAGVSAYLSFEKLGKYDPARMVVKEIFEAMISASQHLTCKIG